MTGCVARGLETQHRNYFHSLASIYPGKTIRAAALIRLCSWLHKQVFKAFQEIAQQLNVFYSKKIGVKSPMKSWTHLAMTSG